MMTYRDFISNINDNPIKDQSDETVQTAVYDWFKYRYIGFDDTDKFLDILQRNVSINYPIYQQKLRIEPGVSQYDWLVQTYRERQLKSNGETGTKRVHGRDIISTTDNKTSGTTTTYDTLDTNTRTGSETHTKDGGHTETILEGERSRSSTSVSGLHTHTESPHVKRTVENGGYVANYTGSEQVASTLPMSNTYTKFRAGLDSGDLYSVVANGRKDTEKGMPARTVTNSDGDTETKAELKWDSPSSQSQGTGTAYNYDRTTQTSGYEYDDGVTGDISTDVGSNDNPDKNDVTTKGITADNRNTTYNNERDTIQYNSIQDNASKTGTVTVAGNGSATGHVENVYGDITDSGSDTRTDREQVTGRNEDIATLLTRATTFIEQSSAFMWLREQLDSCFYPGYYTDDVTEEGSGLI